MIVLCLAECQQLPPRHGQLVGLARACEASDDGPSTLTYFTKLKSIDPKTAERYAYLVSDAGGSSRASQAEGSPVLWSESY